MFKQYDDLASIVQSSTEINEIFPQISWELIKYGAFWKFFQSKESLKPMGQWSRYRSWAYSIQNKLNLITSKKQSSVSEALSLMEKRVPILKGKINAIVYITPKLFLVFAERK